MAGSDFSVTLWVAFFLVAIWAGGRLFKSFRLPPILGQLMVGVLFGPRVLDLVPYGSNGMLCDSLLARRELDVAAMGSGSGSSHGSASLVASFTSAELCALESSTSWRRWVDTGQLKSIWQFAGELGVMMMIFESGMHIHFDKVREVGLKAFVVAVMGTLLPLVSGMALVAAGDPDVVAQQLRWATALRHPLLLPSAPPGHPS